MHIWTYISSKDEKNHKGIRYYIEVYSVIIITKISKSSAGQHCSAYATRSCSAAAEPKHAETLNLLDNFLISEIYTYFGPGNICCDVFHSAHTSSLTNFASEGISAQAAL